METDILCNKVIIVTGGSGGFGKAIAENLLQSGVKVVITSRNIESANNVAEEIFKRVFKNHNKTLLETILPCQFSLENSEDAQALINKTIEHFGKLDALVNNAVSHSTLPPMSLQSMELDQLNKGLEVNLQNVLWLCSKAYPYLEESRGTILNIGSAVVNRHPLGIPLYAIAKGALTRATEVLAAEWAEAGIRVNQINPGFCESDSYKSMGVEKQIIDDLLKYYKQFHALNKIGSADDIIHLVKFLVSSQARWITGSVINVDGGYSVQGLKPPSQFSCT